MSLGGSHARRCGRHFNDANDAKCAACKRDKSSTVGRSKLLPGGEGNQGVTVRCRDDPCLAAGLGGRA